MERSAQMTAHTHMVGVCVCVCVPILCVLEKDIKCGEETFPVLSLRTSSLCVSLCV